MRHGLPENAEIRALAVHPEDDAQMFAATQAGPYRSGDGGESWTSMHLPTEEITWSLLLHPQKSNVLLCGTVDNGVFRTDDGGGHWRQLDYALPPAVCVMGFPTRVIGLAMDPGNPDEMYVALEVGGLVRSLDGGRSWTDINAGLLEFTGQAAYRSRIGSDTDTEGMMDSHALAISPAAPGTVFLANRMGLFVSEDKGESWRDLDIGAFSPITYARDVIVSPHAPETLFAAISKAAVSDAGSLYRSDDSGATWRRFDHGVSMASTLMCVATTGRTDQRIYCAARRGQVFGTEDGGSTWSEYSLPPGVEGVYAIACP